MSPLQHDCTWPTGGNSRYFTSMSALASGPPRRAGKGGHLLPLSGGRCHYPVSIGASKPVESRILSSPGSNSPPSAPHCASANPFPLTAQETWWLSIVSAMTPVGHVSWTQLCGKAARWPRSRGMSGSAPSLLSFDIRVPVEIGPEGRPTQGRTGHTAVDGILELRAERLPCQAVCPNKPNCSTGHAVRVLNLPSAVVSGIGDQEASPSVV